MARGRGAKQFFNFVKGWITESSPMTYPENTAKDLDNVVLDIDGSIRRRAGVAFEDHREKFGLALSDAERDEWAIGVHRWDSAGGIASVNILVSQAGLTLGFHRQNGPNTTASFIGSVDMTPFAVDVARAKTSSVQVAAGRGVLFVVASYINPFYITYDDGVLTTTAINMEQRDLLGLIDGLATDERPATLTTSHLYNLLNQGWSVERINTFFGSTGVSDIEGVITITAEGAAGVGEQTFPSNADISYLGMKANDEGDLVFDPDELRAQTFGNTPAPRGHYILNIFNNDREAVSGVVDAESVDFFPRPSTVTFHNGRVFYSGASSNAVSGHVAYSQQLITLDRAGRCYQEQDPTAEEFNDLLDTDGGILSIPNCGHIVRLAESANGVVVFASNGVWEISGGADPLTATNIAVRKVTDVGCVGAGTVVEADGQFLYWSVSGIILLSADEISGQLNAANISQNTIQIGYQLLGGLSQKGATGVFIPEEKKVVWLYNTLAGYDGVSKRFQYNGVLILDLVLGAFYKYSISNVAGTVPYIAGITHTVPFSSALTDVPLTVTEATVTVGGADVTLQEEQTTATDIPTWKLLCTIDSDTAGKTDLTYGEFSSRSFRDWFNYDGTGANYVSFLETGYDLFGNATVDKQPVYVFTYFSPKSKSLESGSYYELPPLIQEGDGVRVTQTISETLANAVSTMRATQVAKEALVNPDSNMRATQVVNETLADGESEMRVTQTVLEALEQVI